MPEVSGLNIDGGTKVGGAHLIFVFLARSQRRLLRNKFDLWRCLIRLFEVALLNLFDRLLLLLRVVWLFVGLRGLLSANLTIAKL